MWGNLGWKMLVSAGGYCGIRSQLLPGPARAIVVRSIPFNRRKATAIAAGCFVVIAVVLALHPLARTLLQRAACQRNWVVQAHSVRFGLQGIWYRRVQAQSSRVPEFRVNVDAVLVPWSCLVGSRRLVIVGGAIEFPPDLKTAKSAFSSAAADSMTYQKSPGWVVDFSGLSLLWHSQHAAELTAWGVAGRASAVEVGLLADRVHASRGQVGVLLLQSNTQLAKTESGWSLSSAGAERALVTMESHPDQSPHPVTSGLQVTHGGSGKASSSRVGPDAIELMATKFKAAEQRAHQFRNSVVPRLSENATFRLEQLSFLWQRGTQKLEMGPMLAQLIRSTEGVRLTFEQREARTSSRRSLMVWMPERPSTIEINADIGPVSLQSLGVKENDLGLQNVSGSQLAFALKSTIDEEESLVKWQMHGDFSRVSLQQSWLAPRLVEGIQGAFSGTGSVRWQPGFDLAVQELSLVLGKAHVELAGQLERRDAETSGQVECRVPLAACSDLVDALPRGLAPLAALVQLDGTLSLQAGLKFDTAHPNSTDVKWNLANACRVRLADPSVSPTRFREPFILEVPDEHGAMVKRAFGPGTPNWVPFSEMSAHLSSAVLVCEDGRFYDHAGFDSQAIRSSIRDNVAQGRFARGASTVTMQLVKNVYLRREKTFSRKLQEAVLTTLVESTFTKNDILELYLNVVELGPGIYGVGEAAKFYFNTTPAELSPLQAYFLVSLLPNPKAFHFSKNGHVTAGWLKLLHQLMTIGNKRHYVTDEELKAALESDLQFGVSDPAHRVAADSMSPGNDGLREANDPLE